MRIVFKIFLLLVIVAVIALAVLVRFVGGVASRRTDASEPPITKQELFAAYLKQKAVNRQKLVISAEKLQRSSGSRDATGSFVLENGIDVPINEVVVLCGVVTKNGDEIKSIRNKLTDSFSKHAKVAIKGFSLGKLDRRADRLTCFVTDFEYDLEAVKRDLQIR